MTRGNKRLIILDHFIQVKQKFLAELPPSVLSFSRYCSWLVTIKINTEVRLMYPIEIKQ